MTTSFVIDGTANNDIIIGTTDPETINGLAGNDQILGLTDNDSLNGGDGNDSLDGGTGADQLKGEAGDDIYTVDNTGDIVTEIANQGRDLVQSSITYTLGVNVEDLTLTGYYAIHATGNTLNNTIIGNNANNTLNGSTGADVLFGRAGNDTYIVENVNDVVTEALSEGTDLVQSSITYSLPVNVENLTLTGTTAINGIGNALNNVILGNASANSINGGGGNDTLTGSTGANTGADSFVYNTNVAFATSDIGVDAITDFTKSQLDKIVLGKATFTAISSVAGNGFSVLNEFASLTSSWDTSRADIVYDRGTGKLFYNQNGTATGYGTGGHFITLANKPALAGSDFIIQA